MVEMISVIAPALHDRMLDSQILHSIFYIFVTFNMAHFWFLNHRSDLCVRCGHLVEVDQAMTCVCRWPLRVDRDTRMYICWKDLFDTPGPTAVHPVRFWKPGDISLLACLAAQGDRFSHEHVGAATPPISRTPSPCFDWEPPKDAEAAGSSSMSDAASLVAFLQGPVQGELGEQGLPSVSSPAVSCIVYRSLGVSPIRSSTSLTWNRPCPMLLNICMTKILRVCQPRACLSRSSSDTAHDVMCYLFNKTCM